MGRVNLAGLLVALLAASSLWPGPNQSKQAAPGAVPAAQDQDSPTAQGSASHPVLQRRNPRYRLQPEDVFELDFPLVPEYNQVLTVQPDGYVTLRSVGDLHAAGQTTPQLREEIRKAYARILHDPVLTIQLKDYEKPYFIVAGEVQHPGKFDLRGETTVTEALAIAGGFNDNSKHSQILLFRRVSHDWVKVDKLNVGRMFKEGNLSEDPELQPQDMLFVPRNKLSKIKEYIPYPSLSTYISPPPL